MSKDSNKKALDKIKKCLALAKSSNANEAATAMRQAQALMREHNVTSDDVALSDVCEKTFRAGNANTPPKWHSMLVSIISDAFGVRPIFRTRGWNGCDVAFIGIENQPEVAGYAYEVLFRQIKKDRAAHVKSQTRCKPATKTRRGDLFAEAWVYAVRQLVTDFAVPPEHSALIVKYFEKNHPKLNTFTPRSHDAKGNDDRSINAGYRAGKSAYLNKGMNETKRERLTHE
ncbi:DUF2786 domain-containing protein [Thalassolituus oleivorans]|jgi:hypothetical protein|uniref:DUF2786 domain-containing protein n=1 Tax=Thalassolituus oleivorans TaxID=187493 RepID=UPI0023F5703F|nr:DUF2786 domain-containing protein [Thalassolituus oleivorans]